MYHYKVVTKLKFLGICVHKSIMRGTLVKVHLLGSVIGVDWTSIYAHLVFFRLQHHPLTQVSLAAFPLYPYSLTFAKTCTPLT